MRCWFGLGGRRVPASRTAAKCRKSNPPSHSLRYKRGTSRSRRREHVFICMFYPSAALNPTHPDRKVRSAARRARAVAASRSPPPLLTRETLSEVDGRGRTDVRRVLIATATDPAGIGTSEKFFRHARGRTPCSGKNRPLASLASLAHPPTNLSFTGKKVWQGRVTSPYLVATRSFPSNESHLTGSVRCRIAGVEKCRRSTVTPSSGCDKCGVESAM
ncbi:unnamed protein product [Danaus chrysippus]|uniref:(African queen) hypothetical protein n=1 Tax=Danaus chrysippus TaxID=151541 RepID=A0A8J2QK11_9NEOP|nr:unnamed protein product [Danaus chrysippus]